jgi:hypothetical protein
MAMTSSKLNLIKNSSDRSIFSKKEGETLARRLSILRDFGYTDGLIKSLGSEKDVGTYDY